MMEEIWKDIKGFFGISSPSKEMAWIGEMLTQGLAEGIADNASAAVDAAEEMAAGVLGAVQSVDGTNIGVDATVNGGAGIGGTTFIQNNYSPKALSRLDIYRYGNNLAAYMGAVQ